MPRDKLLKVFSSVMTLDSFDSALAVIDDLISQGIDIPGSLESVLVDFFTNKDEASFTSLAKEVLSKNLLMSYTENIKLISFLTKKKWLPLKDAALLLNAIPHVERGKLLPSYVKAIEAADLICEDLSDGFMEVEDDDLLVNALSSI